MVILLVALYLVAGFFVGKMLMNYMGAPKVIPEFIFWIILWMPALLIIFIIMPVVSWLFKYPAKFLNWWIAR